jgi:hypothetical protein
MLEGKEKEERFRKTKVAKEKKGEKGKFQHERRCHRFRTQEITVDTQDMTLMHKMLRGKQPKLELK